MPDHTDILFRLPTFNLDRQGPHHWVPASQNPDLAALVDGNYDYNHNDRVDFLDQNQRIDEPELLEYLYNNRDQFQEEITELGLEDPLERTEGLENFVRARLFEHPNRNQFEEAAVLIQAIVPPSYRFFLQGVEYWGLSTGEDGLSVYGNTIGYAHPLLQDYGSPRPTEILSAPAELRVAECLEYSFLLCVCLRIAGIQASIFATYDHAYVIANLEGERYLLDITLNRFEKTTERGISDRRAIAVHYTEEARARDVQGDRELALELLDVAVEVDPNSYYAWTNRCSLLERMRRFDEALYSCNRALEIDDQHVSAWNNRGIVYADMGYTTSALWSFDRALEIDPGNERVQNTRAKVVRAERWAFFRYIRYFLGI